jgi:putative ABC transport system permease protein
MSKLSQDVRHAIRSLQRSPGFALVVILTLALGIGANTAIFTIVNAVVLRPLPFQHADQLVRVTSELKNLGADDTGTAALELFDYQSRTDLFSGVAGLYPVNANVTGGAEPERIETMLVTWNYFSILGTAPALGRVFGPDDDGPGIPQVAVVSDAYWRRRLGADPHALGRSLVVDGDPFVLVGVMPPGFTHPGQTIGSEQVDLWSPAGYRGMPFAQPDRTRRFLQGALARLQPGVSAARAQQLLDEYGAKQRADFPADYPASNGWHPRVVPLQQDIVGSVRTPMLILLAAVGFVLLIACANVANLMLTRGSRRHHEMAVRASLGATAGRLARQILTESAVLALAGGLLGLLVASWGVRALVALAPSKLPRIAAVSLDAPSLLVSFGLSMAATLLFGLAPALQMRAINALAAVREGARGRSAGPASTRIRNGLVAAEDALAMVLLVGAGLLARTFWALENVSTGFDTANLVTARVWLPRPNDPANGKYLVPEARAAFARESLSRVAALPQVADVALSTQIPLGGYNPPIFFEIDGRATGPQDVRPTIHNFRVSPGYFSTLRIPIVKGRAFTDADRLDTEPVAVVTAAAVRRFWPDANPIGARVRISPRLPWMTVVGVVGDVLTRGLDDAAQPILYQPLEQASSLALAFLVRTRGNAVGLEEALTREVRGVDQNLPVYAVRSMDELLARNVANRQFLMRILIAFGAAAIGLALLGIYGVISFAVVQRTREIGIRVAIGAQRRQVLGLVLRQGLSYALAGMAAGTIGGIATARLISSQLFGVSAFDPVSLAAVVVLMTLVAVIAVLVPARRAANIDPITALRLE